MGGTTNRKVASMLVNLVTASGTHQWAQYVYTAHVEVTVLYRSFTVDENAIASLVAPRGNVITSNGDPSSVAQDAPPTFHTDVTPRPLDVAAAAPRGVRFVATALRKLAEWRAFFRLLLAVPLSTQPKLLTHSNHGSVTIMHSNIPPDRAVSSSTTKAAIIRITRAP